MSTCYKRLDLPLSPVKDPDSIVKRAKLTTDSYHMFNVNPVTTLTDEILGIFDNLNLCIRRVTVFHYPAQHKEKDSLLHTDIRRVGNEWKKLTFAVNWELNNINVKLSWWDTSKTEVFPGNPNFFWFDPHGIHYGGRYNLGVDPVTDHLIESVDTLTGPILVRTNIPHNVYIPEQELTDDIRCGISIRFEEDHFAHWDDVVEYFKPITL